jgi:DNA-binding transcriptional LysR family regulator
MTLTQLRMFVAVAEAGSLRAAARRLNVAQSGVTQQLRKLESSVGGPLFERGHRGARLTTIGERLRLRADVILGECMRTEEEMRQLRGESTGQVSLGLAAEATMRLFPALLASFRERCPRIDVHLTSATSRVLTSWVRDGSLDFALALVSQEADVHDLETTRLFDSEVAVIARRGHPLMQARTLAELRDGDWVSTRALRAAPATNRLAMLFDAAGLAPPRIAVTTEAVFDTLHCVANTDYLALEPARLVEHAFFREHVAIVPVAEHADRTPVCLLRRAGVPLTPAAQELATMAVSFARMLPASAGRVARP